MENSFLTIEVYFDHGPEKKRYALQNQNWNQVKQFRETVVSAGLMLPMYEVAPMVSRSVDRWCVILPWRINSIEITRQSKKFGE